MNPANYKQYLNSHSVWFRGYNPVSSQAISQAENRLGVTFPQSLKWLLTQYGYWRATGVSGLPAIVGTTLANREHFPDHWIILGQPEPRRLHSKPDKNGSEERKFQKESIILVLSQKHLWDGKAVFHCNSIGHIIRQYSGFTEYTVASQHSVAKHSAEEYRVCFPSFHPACGEPLLWEEENFHLEELQRRLLETILFYELCLKTNSGLNFFGVGKLGGFSEKPIPIASVHFPRVAENHHQLMPESQLPNRHFSAELIAEMIESRRDYIVKYQQDIPACYQDSSSSPRTNLQRDSNNTEGHLLIVEAISGSLDTGTAEKNHSHGLLPDHLIEFGIVSEQIVSLICNTQSDQSQDWLVCWLPDSQMDQVRSRLKSYRGNLKHQFISPAKPMELISELKKVA